MLFKEIIAVYCQNHIKTHTHSAGKEQSYLTLKQVVHMDTKCALKGY
jgi:hypothetical protein